MSSCTKPGACASPACIVENTCLFPHVDGSAAVGEMAERLRNILDGVTEVRDTYGVSMGFMLAETGPGSYQGIEATADEAAISLEAQQRALALAGNTLMRLDRTNAELSDRALNAEAKVEALVRERDEARAETEQFAAALDSRDIELRTIEACLARATKAEAERDEARDDLSRWMLRMANIREAAGVGHGPMLEDLPAEIGKLRAERDALAARLAACREGLSEVARCDVPASKEGHYLAHRNAVKIARSLLSSGAESVSQDGQGPIRAGSAPDEPIPSPLPDGGRG